MIGVRTMDPDGISKCVVCSYDMKNLVYHRTCPECGTDYNSFLRIFAFSQDDQTMMRFIFFGAIGLGGILMLRSLVGQIVSFILVAGSVGWLWYVFSRVPPIKRQSYLLLGKEACFLVAPLVYSADQIAPAARAQDQPNAKVSPVSVESLRDISDALLYSDPIINNVAKKLRVPPRTLRKVLAA